jgi:hypothetical protein
MTAVIEEALTAIRDEYEDWKSGNAAREQEYMTQIATLEGLVKKPVRRGRPPRAEKSKYSIGDDKYQKIVEYFETHDSVRQKDLGDKLDLNSGTISVGLHKAQDEGIVQMAGTEDGSHVWEKVRVMANAA